MSIARRLVLCAIFLSISLVAYTQVVTQARCTAQPCPPPPPPPPTTYDGVSLNDTHIQYDLVIEGDQVVSATSPSNTGGNRTYNLSGQHFYHVIQGFDTVGVPRMVMELTKTLSGGASVGEKLVIQNGTLSDVDSSGHALRAAAMLGGSHSVLPGASARYSVPSLAVSNPASMAAALGATLAYPNSTTAKLSTYSKTNSNESIIMTLVQQSGTWILSSIDSYLTGTGSNSQHNNLTYSNVVYYVNAVNNASRASAHPYLAARQSIPAPVAQAGSSGASALYLPDAASPQLIKSTTNGSNVAFLHGLESSGSTWATLAPEITSDFALSTVITPDLGGGGTNRLSQWNTDVTSAIANSTVSPGNTSFLAVGHSAGGLVGRSVAQSASSPIRGVITLDTPHQGSLLLANLQIDAVANLFRQLGTLPCDQFTCIPLAAYVAAGVSAAAVFAPVLLAPATIDLEPGSAYDATLNAHSESFPKVGLIGETDPTGIAIHTLIDFLPGDGSAGRFTADVVYALELAYDAGSVTYLIFAEQDYQAYLDTGDVTYLEFMQNDLNTAYEYAQIEADIAIPDEFWSQTAACNPTGLYCDPGGSDGVVSAGSQTYPLGTGTTPVNYTMSGFDATHAKSTRSAVTRQYVDLALEQQFFAPPPICGNVTISSSTNPGTTSFQLPFQGQLLSFIITASASCEWAAAASSPWIHIIGNSSGSVGGQLQILTDINLDTNNSRTATISVGASTISLTEAAMPSGLSLGGFTLGQAYVPVAQWQCSPTLDPGCQNPVPRPIGDSPEHAAISIVGGPNYTIPGISSNWIQDQELIFSTINADPSSIVTAGVDIPSRQIYLVSKTAGSSAAYSGSVITDSTGLFVQASVILWPLGTNLQ